MKKDLDKTDILRPDENTVVNNYSDLSEKMSVAKIEVKGRHPLESSFANTVCDTIIYVLEGRGDVVIKGEELCVEAGTPLHIGKDQPYYFKGDFTFLYISTPPFKDNQLKVVS